MALVHLCYRYHLIVAVSVILLVLTSFLYDRCYYSEGNVNPAPLYKETDEIHSTCGAKADRRGFHQYVIAYSIYGDFSREDVVQRYLNPMQDTLERIADFYPGWITRIYHNASTEDQLSVLERTFGGFDHVDLCNATRIIRDLNLGDIFAMTWRFLPVLDPMVDRLMSRDADSPLMEREVVAVHEWLNSNETFHLLRDHPGHCVPMLGGLWAVKLKKPKRSKLAHVVRKMLTFDHSHKVGYDQTLLNRYLWAYVKKDSMAHDSYCCSHFESVRPFPTRRDGRNFLGMVTSWNDSVKAYEECPTECRPPYGFDWDYC